MSDVALVAAVGLVSSAVVAVVWLRQRAAALLRMEQREEREHGIIPRIEACEKTVEAALREQKTFLANARQR